MNSIITRNVSPICELEPHWIANNGTDRESKMTTASRNPFWKVVGVKSKTGGRDGCCLIQPTKKNVGIAGVHFYTFLEDMKDHMQHLSVKIVLAAVLPNCLGR